MNNKNNKYQNNNNNTQSASDATDKVTKMYNKTAQLIMKKSKIERQIQSTAVSVLVVLFECIPVAILNVYSVVVLRIINLILILSTVSSAMTVGYKGASVNQLFTLLSEKKTLEEDLKNQIAEQVEFEQEMHESDIDAVSDINNELGTVSTLPEDADSSSDDQEFDIAVN